MGTVKKSMDTRSLDLIVEAARPEAVEADPEEALEATEMEPFAVSGSDHRPLLAEREDLQVEQGPILQQASQGGEQGDEDCYHARNAMTGDQKNSRESTSTRFLIGASECLCLL